MERFLGYAEIREVFGITKVGKVAGCMVTEGMVRRGSAAAPRTPYSRVRAISSTS